MRSAIREKIMNLTGLQVYEPHMASAKTSKPYIVVKFATERRDTGMMYGYVKSIEVWPYVEPTSFEELDALLDQLIQGLHRRDIVTSDGTIFQLEYRGSIGSEYYDPDWDALTKPIEFTTIAIHERR